MLREVMSKLNSAQKDEVMARIQSFTFSGFRHKLTGNVCRYVFFWMYIKYVCSFRYVGSLVGRDFKAFAQLALFVIGPYLNEFEVKAWLFLSKVVLP